MGIVWSQDANKAAASAQKYAEVLYKTTDFWSKECERAIRWDDPQVAIAWPLDSLGGIEPLLAEKDAAAPWLADAQAAEGLWMLQR